MRNQLIQKGKIKIAEIYCFTMKKPEIQNRISGYVY